MGSENLRAAMLMIAAMALFAIEDTFVKLLSDELPVSEVVGIVGLLGWLVFWGLLAAQRKPFWTKALLSPPVVIRNVSEAVGSIGFVVALALTDLSSTSSILQALPLVIVLGAALFLREPVGWRRWSAIAVGFAGVLMVIRPGLAGFQPMSLIAFVGVIGLAARDLVTRRIPPHIHSLQLAGSAFLTLLIGAVVLGIVMGDRFVMPGALHWVQFACALGVGLAAYSLLVTATRLGEAAAVAPFRYSRLVFALILAVLVFDERPDAMTLIGGVVIVGSGCYAMWREAVQRRRKLRAAGFITP